MTAHNVNKQSELNYNATYDFSLMWDFSLPEKAKIIYQQIKQMVNNPNRKGAVQFSYKWICEMLGIGKRWAIKLVQMLIKKGLITHHQIDYKHYEWRLVDNTEPMVQKLDRGVNSEITSLPLNNIYIKNSESSFFNLEEKEAIIEQKLPDDRRTSDEFLSEAQKHIEKPTLFDYSRGSRFRGLLKILSNQKTRGNLFYASVGKKSKTKYETKSTVPWRHKEVDKTPSQPKSVFERGIKSLKTILKYNPKASAAL